MRCALYFAAPNVEPIVINANVKEDFIFVVSFLSFSLHAVESYAITTDC